MNYYIALQDRTVWGGDDEPTEAEHAAACRRMEEWLCKHEGDDLSILARPCWHGAVPGIYQQSPSGGMQLLGCSVPVPDDVRDLVAQAWEHACQTWDEDASTMRRQHREDCDLPEVQS